METAEILLAFKKASRDHLTNLKIYVGSKAIENHNFFSFYSNASLKLAEILKINTTVIKINFNNHSIIIYVSEHTSLSLATYCKESLKKIFPLFKCTCLSEDIVDSKNMTLKYIKNHPLYIAPQFLKKYEAFDPLKDKILFKTEGVDIHPREAVCKLRSKDAWYTQFAKIIKEGEIPFKIVSLGKNKKDQFLYGHWQTIDYEPLDCSEAKVIPKNEFGNIDLFQQRMLPKGCIYIAEDEGWKVATRLGIDFAHACTGFDFHGTHAAPRLQGIVILNDKYDLFKSNFNAILQEEKEKEKHTGRNLGFDSWRKVIKSSITFFNYLYNQDDKIEKNTKDSVLLQEKKEILAENTPLSFDVI